MDSPRNLVQLQEPLGDFSRTLLHYLRQLWGAIVAPRVSGCDTSTQNGSVAPAANCFPFHISHCALAIVNARVAGSLFLLGNLKCSLLNHKKCQLHFSSSEVGLDWVRARVWVGLPFLWRIFLEPELNAVQWPGHVALSLCRSVAAVAN